MKKFDDPINEVGHKMKIFNKEHKPSKIEVLVPTFNNRKDNIANTVVAYLVNYVINNRKIINL